MKTHALTSRSLTWLPGVLLYGYSLLVLGALCLLRGIAFLSPKIRRQVEQRANIRGAALGMAKARARYRHAVVFFCSSAGEFEQARPLIDRLQHLGTVYVQVFFFSESGLSYAKARGERMPYGLAPPDSLWHWGWIYSALRPELSVVVRHEWWPGFLATAREWGDIYLIDAHCPESVEKFGIKGTIKRCLQRFLIAYFDRIFTVAEGDAQRFKDALGVSADRLSVVGDTKYDRAIERAAERQVQINEFKGRFGQIFPGKKMFIAGSVHAPDVKVLVKAFGAFSQLPEGRDWLLVLAPHAPTETNLESFEQVCREGALNPQRYSALTQGQERAPTVLIIDCMGILAELYATGNLAYVGGAMHHKIHNVLEPAVHGLALACGPFYKNSQEAVHLVQEGLLTSVNDADALTRWWRAKAMDLGAAKGKALATVQQLSGATDKIFAAMRLS